MGPVRILLEQVANEWPLAGFTDMRQGGAGDKAVLLGIRLLAQGASNGDCVIPLVLCGARKEAANDMAPQCQLHAGLILSGKPA